MPLRSSMLWNLTEKEINIMVRASVLEKFGENSPDAQKLIAQAYKIQEKADKEMVDYINKQKPELKEILFEFYRIEQERQK